MRKFAFLLALALLIGLTAPAAKPAQARTRSARPAQVQSCAPTGYTYFDHYDWIANGGPTDDSCWTYDPTRASIVSDSTCGSPSNAWEFNYSGWISQSFTIAAGMTGQQFNMAYYLDFDDPNNDGAWNRFTVSVRDATTGTALASDRYYGNWADLYCARRDLTWSGNLTGHTINVYISGTRGYSDTHIRVRSIYLWQYH